MCSTEYLEESLAGQGGSVLAYREIEQLKYVVTVTSCGRDTRFHLPQI